MEELEIAIEALENRKLSLQLSIGRPFDYGRTPADDEYLSLQPLVTNLATVEDQLSFAKDLLKTIISNKNVTA